MMAKKKSVLLVFVILTLFLQAAVFAGGAQQKGGQQGNRAAALTEIGFNASGYPIVSGPYTFTGLVSKNSMHGSYNNMEILQQMEKETGVKVEWIEVPENSFTEQKNLRLASDDLPDVFFSGIGDAEQLRYGPIGTLLPLEDLINEYAPRIKELFANRPDIQKFVTTPNGHEYVLPGLEELLQRTNQDNAFINKTWLDKLGLKVPTTFDEFYAVLRAFKEKDPNGNGKRDEIPFSFALFGSQFDILSFYAGFGQGDYPSHVMVNNGKVYFTANTNEWRNATIYFKKLYSEGLIDQEAFTHDRSRYFGKGVEPDEIYGAFMGWFDENEVGNERAKNDYVVLPPLIGVDGKQHWNYWPENVLERGHFAITSKMKHPEVAIRWADLCYEPDHSLQLKYGPFGINLRKEGNRVIQLTPPAGQSVDEFRYQHCPAVTMPFAMSAEVCDNFAWAENTVRKQERYQIYNKFQHSLSEVYPKVYFTSEEEDELAILRTDIVDFVNQTRSKFITGTENIDTGWNNYVQTLNRAGLERYLEIYQKALDRYNGK
ncbi:MAG: extracellular solute-binding protein [Treponema sp.]|jgi:putative aldouronate transport system substrate-binding protein|nr:extracellular solute-binding protein [Treponema sp.]